MRFIHSREYLNAGDTVVVECSHQCNVRVMSDNDFQNFKNGFSHRYLGGHYKRLPAHVTVPSSGYWNTTIDLGGSPSGFRYNIGYLKSDVA